MSYGFQNPSSEITMPLPKTATIAARATEVYCEVWSVILQRFCKMPPVRSSDLNDLSQLLPYLRQLLTCCACAGLLDKAMVSLTCGHCYCYECQFREPLLKIHCRQCRERTGLVIERQLQLVVNCYKSMCHILGEELRKDPLAFSDHVKTEQRDREDKRESKDELGTLPAKLVAEDSKGSRNDKSQPSAMTNGVAVDPIAEIVREVEKGTKVSRAIFVIKPPSKYMNAKAAPTGKRDPTCFNTRSSALSSVVKDESKESTPEVQVKLSDEMGANESGDMEVAVESIEKEVEPDKLDKPRKRSHKKKTEKKRKPSPSIDNDIDMPPSELKFPDTGSPGDEAKPNLVKVPLSARLSLSSRQRHLNAKKRKKALNILCKSRADSRKGKSIQDTSNGESSEEKKEELGSLQHSIKLELIDLDDGEFFNQVEVKKLDISVDSLDSQYLRITEDKVSLLPQEQLSHKLNLALKAHRPASAHKRTLARDQWKKEIRKRTLSPFCSRFVVTRRGEDIANSIAAMVSAAKTKRKMRQKAKMTANNEGDKNHTAAIPQVSRSRPHIKRSQRHSLPTLPAPNPPLTDNNDIPIPEHISIFSADGKDAINDADINWTEFSNFFESTEEEESMAELSTLSYYSPTKPKEQQQKEQNLQHKEQKVPEPHPQQQGQLYQPHQHQHKKKHLQQHPPHLPPLPLGPQLPRVPLNRELEPIRFNEYEPSRMMRPPPSPHPRHRLPLPPPHRPHPGIHRPSHLPHLPQTHPLPPPTPHPHSMMNFSPMMGPPDLPPPPEYFPPPMTPGGMRQDMSGFSSPMTPNRGAFPPEPCIDGMFRQGSPSQHSRGGNFPFPNSNSGGTYSPVRGGFQPRPTPPTTPVLVQQPQKKKKKSSSSSDALSSMVGKMKVKSPAITTTITTPPKTQLATPTTPTKKRRSPGYSEAGWRCRCGTNKIMFPDKVCAKGKCPCYAKGTACKNCLCRFCHNPFGSREPTKTALPMMKPSPATATPPPVAMETESTAVVGTPDLVVKVSEVKESPPGVQGSHPEVQESPPGVQYQGVRESPLGIQEFLPVDQESLSAHQQST